MREHYRIIAQPFRHFGATQACAIDISDSFFTVLKLNFM